MSKLYYSTIDGTQIGRASYYYRTKDSVNKQIAAQNIRATSLGIKARYASAEIEEAGIESKEIRD